MQVNHWFARRRAGFRGALAILLFVVGATLLAQQASTIHVDVKVVNVLATVHDKNGNIVNTLTKDDFTLEEDGRPQTIKYFSRDTDLPLTLGLLVDTSWSQAEKLAQEKTASAAFANEVLREGKDSAFLIHFDREAELLRDLTTSREKLVSALQELEVPAYERQQKGDPDDSGRGRSRFGGGTVLYDSVFLASDELMQKQPGRKAIILLTNGVDHGSKMSLDSAIEAAQRSDTVVYSIYFPGEENARRGGFSPPWGGDRRGGGWPHPGGGNWPGGGGGGGGRGGRQGPNAEPRVDGKQVLERLSRETGGRMFEVSKKEPVEKIYAQIQDELRNQYNLGYTSDRAPGEGFEYRHIFLATRQPDLTVQAREGYYASQPAAGKPGQ